MENKELLDIWKSYDQKLEDVLTLNKDIVYDITKNKLNKKISSLRWPKGIALLLGIPYTILLCFITFIAFKAEAFAVMLGFGIISLIMIGVIIGYMYQLSLVSKINRSEEIIEVQQQIAGLKISSYNMARLSFLQLPFWSICWISIDTLMESPLIYGGVNLIVFLGLAYIAYWLYQNLDIDNPDSQINKLVFSGSEWAPIIQSAEILEQLKEYK